MRMLVVGDIHIKNKHHSRSIDLVNDIISNTERERPDCVMLLGDVLDGADIIHSNCLLQLSKLLLGISQICPVYVIMGNHDASTPHIEMPENHALQCFKALADRNINIIDLPTVLNPQSDKKIVIMPYLPPGSFMKHMPQENVGLVFCHQEFEGCTFDGGNRSEHGDPIPDGFNIISGHIHAEQRLKNLWYPGTPTQTRFGESDSKGYFLISINESTCDYEIVKKLTPVVSKFVSTAYRIGQSVDSLNIDQNNVNRAVISATPSEILSFKKSKEYESVIEAFKGNVKFNVLKDESIQLTQDTSKVQRKSFIETLSNKANDLGLTELLEESLSK